MGGAEAGGKVMSLFSPSAVLIHVKYITNTFVFFFFPMSGMFTTGNYSQKRHITKSKTFTDEHFMISSVAKGVELRT